MKRRDEPIPALSTGLSHLMLGGLLMLAAFPFPYTGRLTVEPSPPAETHDAPRAEAPAASPAPADTPEQKDEWPQAEVAQAKEQCAQMLSGVAAEYEMLEPVRKGPCGLPAPVLLKSVGSEPTVVFDPPVEVNCRMVAALGNWVKSTLQPKAREQLRSEVRRIVGASGYSCRNIYNLPNARLSQHALANAIDVGGFALENGRTVWVSKGWGMTARDIKAAKAKAEADARAKAKAVAEAKTKGKAAGSKEDAAGAGKDEATETGAAKSGKKGQPVAQASLAPVALVGQKKGGLLAVTAFAPPKPTKDAIFLRSIHDGACGAFGTVLGPEANDPHRSHFHLDLIPRKGRGYCE